MNRQELDALKRQFWTEYKLRPFTKELLTWQGEGYEYVRSWFSLRNRRLSDAEIKAILEDVPLIENIVIEDDAVSFDILNFEK